MLLGCAAFGALGILLGGTLRAEVVLAVANAVWFVLLLAGGIVVPLDRLPGPVAAVGGAPAVRSAGRGAADGPDQRRRHPARGRCWSCSPGPRPAAALAVRTVRLR